MSINATELLRNEHTTPMHVTEKVEGWKIKLIWKERRKKKKLFSLAVEVFLLPLLSLNAGELTGWKSHQEVTSCIAVQPTHAGLFSLLFLI